MTRRVFVALMGVAMRAYWEAGGDSLDNNPADPYMTVLGYFNALRELGGGRRILEEEVQNTIKQIGRKKRYLESSGFFLAEARRMLGNPFRIKSDPNKRSVDCALATNMISVGLDIPRLGLMTVGGHPKTTAEYIQATSRVGRDPSRPGLVVTLLNMHKPRDRPHYERFRHFHETFCRTMEAASVTPFAARALDRGFAGALTALARQASAAMTPPWGSAAIQQNRAEIEALLRAVFCDRISDQPGSTADRDDVERNEQLQSVRNCIDDLLDAWCSIASDAAEHGQRLLYQRREGGGSGQPLLRGMMEENINCPRQRKFRANRSLRDVEPEVCLALVDSPN